VRLRAPSRVLREQRFDHQAIILGLLELAPALQGVADRTVGQARVAVATTRDPQRGCHRQGLVGSGLFSSFQERPLIHWHVREGVQNGKSPDLEGGGLRRSSGGWELVPRVGRGRERWAFDERTRGSSDFVREVLAEQNQPGKHPAPEPGEVLSELCLRVAAHFKVGCAELRSESLRRPALDARAVACHLAVCHYGLSLTTVARHLGSSRFRVARSLQRAAIVLATARFSPDEFVR
jgi:hypothetical protein